MDHGQLNFRASSFCAVGTCLEIGRSSDGDIFLRDSKWPEAVLQVSASEWETFVQGVKAGEFDAL